jgi:hypothetical protein
MIPGTQHSHELIPLPGVWNIPTSYLGFKRNKREAMLYQDSLRTAIANTQQKRSFPFLSRIQIDLSQRKSPRG